MSARRQPEQQAPPVLKLRVQYAKRGRARFASHRDFGRAFERALRRADIPMAFSSGFSPHPRISYANASPTGAATEAEYLELGLAAFREPDAVRDALNAAMPDGLVIVKVVVAGPGALADRLTASVWRVDLPEADESELAAAVAGLLAAESFEVQRMTKTGLRTFDVRSAVRSLTASANGFDLVSAIGEPLVRPDDVLTALRQLEPGLSGTGLITRLAQGTWDGQRILDPLAT
ncbi:MAG TPA: TIGR03936 family radical SAM-associated protein [Propionicimonas sp.]|nr:TIGR03936 family radical SAM-associated protein [Propionicimonas sp.]HRA05564.1 TIGR03936 family radical SAM-associated protein [Propionicimonas sp.]